MEFSIYFYMLRLFIYLVYEVYQLQLKSEDWALLPLDG